MFDENSAKPFKIHKQYANLARGYTELTLYREAEAIATRALELNPRADHARYDRAMARWNSGNLRAAAADLDALVDLRGARFFGVCKTREILHELLQSETDLSNAIKDLSWPHPDSDAAEPNNNDHHPCERNESGAFRHSPPCSDHNRSKCRREDCPYSHTPDANSIRGTDGRNVCIRYLVGRCSRKGCLYSHSTSGLPKDITVVGPSLDSRFIELQWWNDPARMEGIRQCLKDRDARLKQEYEARVVARAEKAVKLQAAQHADNAESVPSDENLPPSPPVAEFEQKTNKGKSKPKTGKEKKKSNKVQMADSVVDAGLVQNVLHPGPPIVESERKTRKGKSETASEKKSTKKVKVSTKSAKVESMGPVPISQRRKIKQSYYPMSKTVKSLEKLANCGFTDDDVAELAELGVNPWDANAQSILARLDDY